MSKTNASGQQLKNGVGSGELGGELSQKIRFLNERFIAKAKEIHGDRYDYSKVAYTTSKERVTIICKKNMVNSISTLLAISADMVA